MPNTKDRSEARFGSLAAVQDDISLMAAFERKADVQSGQNSENQGPLSARSGRQMPLLVREIRYLIASFY